MDSDKDHDIEEVTFMDKDWRQKDKNYQGEEFDYFAVQGKHAIPALSGLYRRAPVVL
jgi:hypothetical protein